MNDDQLRTLVRAAIAKQMGAGEAPAGPSAHLRHDLHASHGVYDIPREDENGPCVIEPSVPCTHCNYCKSHGH